METGYVNARVRGMHSFLMDKSRLDSLILKPDIDSFVTELENSPYRDDVQRAFVTISGIRGIEFALRLNLIRTYRKILSLVEGETGEKYIHIFLSRWDIHNIKTIIRGKKVHIAPQEIQDCLVPAGELDEATLAELIKQPDVKAVIDLLATWGQEYSIPLTRHFEEYNERSDLVILEYALDQFYYQQSLALVSGRSGDEKIIRDLVATEIDVTNIKSILTLLRDGIDPDDAGRVLLPGGKFLDSKKMAAMLRSEKIADIFPILEPTPYRFLAELSDKKNARVKMSVYQNALDKFLIINGIKTFRGDPLSITIIIGYLWAKYTEVINLRIIARCKNAMVTPEEMEAELIYV
jgi:V/A-type H+-transporting ATPase subunit C